MGVAEVVSAETHYVSPHSKLSLWSDASSQSQEFPMLDKNNVIQNWVQEGNVVFTKDNFVDYSEVVSVGGVSHHTPADPSIFRVGQIVELGLSLKVVHTHESSSQYSFLVHMDNLLLLNCLPSMSLRQEEDMFEFENLSTTHHLSRLALEELSGQPSHSSVLDLKVLSSSRLAGSQSAGPS
ncbi:hypothetical protein BDR05DRAFT_1005109 [Suillus weaverae]|nr:hypothetical protein BDR05DRAFT_1005109 [Suillus weaverae]